MFTERVFAFFIKLHATGGVDAAVRFVFRVDFNRQFVGQGAVDFVGQRISTGIHGHFNAVKFGGHGRLFARHKIQQVIGFWQLIGDGAVDVVEDGDISAVDDFQVFGFKRRFKRGENRGVNAGKRLEDLVDELKIFNVGQVDLVKVFFRHETDGQSVSVLDDVHVVEVEFGVYPHAGFGVADQKIFQPQQHVEGNGRVLIITAGKADTSGAVHMQFFEEEHRGVVDTGAVMVDAHVAEQ